MMQMRAERLPGEGGDTCAKCFALRGSVLVAGEHLCPRCARQLAVELIRASQPIAEREQEESAPF